MLLIPSRAFLAESDADPPISNRMWLLLLAFWAGSALGQSFLGLAVDSMGVPCILEVGPSLFELKVTAPFGGASRCRLLADVCSSYPVLENQQPPKKNRMLVFLLRDEERQTKGRQHARGKEKGLGTYE